MSTLVVKNLPDQLHEKTTDSAGIVDNDNDWRSEAYTLIEPPWP